MEKTDFVELILTVVVAYLFLDVVAFFIWGMSGQVPPDSIYVGSITHSVLSIFF